MRTSIVILILVAIAVTLAACGAKRRYGDEGGTPVAFVVTLDRAFVNGMRNRQGRVGIGAGAGFGSGGHSSGGVGLGMSFSATNVDVVGGDGPAQGQVFHRDLEWGENRFSVPLKPGRILHLTVQASGGREGWESVGEVAIPATGGTVHLDLGEAGPRLSAD